MEILQRKAFGNFLRSLKMNMTVFWDIARVVALKQTACLHHQGDRSYFLLKANQQRQF
jgi:hypothetical protein